jgi:hypothetical protein
MTSLFSRLQKLNKEATPGPWHVTGLQLVAGDKRMPSVGAYPYGREFGAAVVATTEPEYNRGKPNAQPAEQDAALIVECRNSLPAVLNAIDLLRRLSEWDALAPPVQAPFGDGPIWKREIDAALEPFMEETP